MSSLKSISNYIFNNKELLANEIVNGVVHSIDMEIPPWEQEQAINMYIEFVSFIGEYVVSGEEKIPDSLLEWSKKNAAMVSLDGNLSILVVRYLPTRNVITEILTNLAVQFNLSLHELSKMIIQVNRMLDVSLNETVANYEFLVSEYKKTSQMEIAKVATPVIPVKDGIIVLPLVGRIDTFRIKYLIENSTPKIANIDVNYVIIDFSGVYKIDKVNIRLINEMVQMIRLMGINVIATGVSPDLAKMAIIEGIEISSIVYPNLKIALESIH